jgi:hypothetical protein
MSLGDALNKSVENSNLNGALNIAFGVNEGIAICIEFRQ